MSLGLILLIIVALVALAAILIYNRLVTLRQATSQAWGDIDVQLKQRHDLVPNLVETVKGYAAHERGALQEVVAARSAAMSARGVEGQVDAENQLTAALGRLFALSEAYPDLKANQNFMQLQSELADIENKIAASRRFFNNAVAEYNTAQEQFPAALLARQLGFRKRDFFEVTGEERSRVETPPSVSFS